MECEKRKLKSAVSSLLFLCVQTTTKRMKVVRDVVKRAMGLAPYEKRILEVIKVRCIVETAFVFLRPMVRNLLVIFSSADRRRQRGEARIQDGQAASK